MSFDSNNCYLKNSVKFEPLLWQWYAWTHLISPMSASFSVLHRHLKIMDSFVKAPHVHAKAISNPTLAGGSFMDIPTKFAPQIKALMDQTKHECDDLLKLATDYKIFNESISKQATGESLQKWYRELPKSLQGLVELNYDISNRAHCRLIEPLVYLRHYNEAAQSMSISPLVNDDRPFTLSTPRLDSGANNDLCCHLNIPFSSPFWDALFTMRDHAGNLNDLLCKYGIGVEIANKLAPFFSNEPSLSASDKNYDGENIRVRYFGHACILLQTKQSSILIDPVISYDIGSTTRFTYSDLPDEIDVILITHAHKDHVLLETLLQLRHKTKKIIVPTNHRGNPADPSLKLALSAAGFTQIQEVYALDNIPISDGEILCLPFFGEHGDLNIDSKICYRVRLQNKNILFFADSKILDEEVYTSLAPMVGEVEMMFIGLANQGAPMSWLYGPYLTHPTNQEHNNSRSLSASDADNAIRCAITFKPKHAHVYAMGREPWLQFIMAQNLSNQKKEDIEVRNFLSGCNQQGIESSLLYLKQQWELV